MPSRMSRCASSTRAALRPAERRRGEDERGERAVAEAGALDLPPRARDAHLGGLDVVLLEREDPELGEAQHLHERRGDRAVARAVLERPAGRLAVAGEVQRRALEQPAEPSQAVSPGSRAAAAAASARMRSRPSRAARTPRTSATAASGPSGSGASAAAEAARGGRGPVLDAVAIAGGERRSSPRRGRGADAAAISSGAKRSSQPRHDRVAAAHDPAGGDAPQQLGGAVDVARRDGVVDRAVGLAARGVPGAGPAVQVALDLGLAPAQLGAEHVREQAVVAVAVVGAVERRRA